MNAEKRVQLLSGVVLASFVVLLTLAVQPACKRSSSDISGPSTTTAVQSTGGTSNSDGSGGACPDFSPPSSHTITLNDDGCSAMHEPGFRDPLANGCDGCHGVDLTGDYGPSCFTCHGMEWGDGGQGGEGEDGHGHGEDGEGEDGHGHGEGGHGEGGHGHGEGGGDD